MPPVINVHTHYQPGSVLPIIEPYGIEMVTAPDGSWHFRSGDVEYNIPGTPDKFWGSGLGGQIPEMDAAGIDINVLQPSPMIFSYHLDPEVNQEFSRAFNNETAKHIAEHPTRFWGSAQLPMQDLEMAAAELERSINELGLKSCSVGFILGPDKTLADPECDEFLSTVERLDVPLLLHPVALGQDMDVVAGRASWLLKYQMDWAWGYLFTETVAVVGFIFSGALDRHPDLRVMIPHGGGMIPVPARAHGISGEGVRRRSPRRGGAAAAASGGVPRALLLRHGRPRAALAGAPDRRDGRGQRRAWLQLPRMGQRADLGDDPGTAQSQRSGQGEDPRGERG